VKSFKQFLNEDSNKNYVVIYGGRFQPMHKGHHAVYKKACDMFGADDVYISTSDKTNLDPKKGKISPFNFEEKKLIMNKMYDIDPKKIIKTKSPIFAPPEIVDDHPDKAVIMVVGGKDAKRYQQNEYNEFTSFHSLENGGHYFFNAGDKADGISSTDVREHLKTGYKEAFVSTFGKHDEDIYNLVSARLQDQSK
jgi:cytidyltransferase-like protein